MSYKKKRSNSKQLNHKLAQYETRRDTFLKFLGAEGWRFMIRARPMCYVSCFLPNAVSRVLTSLKTQKYRRNMCKQTLVLGLAITKRRYLQLLNYPVDVF